MNVVFISSGFVKFRW